MSIQDGTYEFKLKRPIKYAFDGQTQETDFVILQEPTMEHVKYSSSLEDMIMKSQIEAFEKSNQVQSDVGEVVKPFNEQVQEIEAQTEEIAVQIYGGICKSESESVSLQRLNSIFGKMVCIPRPKKPICLIDGRAMMTQAIWDTMYPVDAQNMALRWCAFFVMPSEEGGMISSEPQQDSVTEPMEV